MLSPWMKSNAPGPSLHARQSKIASDPARHLRGATSKRVTHRGRAGARGRAIGKLEFAERPVAASVLRLQMEQQTTTYMFM